MNRSKINVRTLPESTTCTFLRSYPTLKPSRASLNYSTAAKSRRTTRKGICILFEGVHYQTLSSFARDHGFDAGGRYNMKMKWYKQQLSKCPLKDCLRFLCSESLTSISKSTPKDVREGLVDAKNMKEVFVPATRKKNIGNAGLFRMTVSE